MAHERLRPNYLFDEEKIKQLKQLAPECFEDGKINFETLRQNLGDWAQDEEDADLEHFGLFWPGKREARKMAAIPPQGTLEPVYGEGLKADGTPDTDGVNDSKNIFIEGENLEVLKILQKSYAGKIKMIYIDPPYNTGNDFVYDDDFTEPLQEYLRRTGQVDEEGKPLTTNKRSDGRFHSKWLSMMYPRLRLARNLLREDGVIFISIDDNEVHNLRAICNEIFGEENFVTTAIWEKNYAPKNDSKWFSANHDYIIAFAADKDIWRPNLLERSEELLARYKNPDNDPRGLWQSDNMTVKTYSPDYDYEITSPTGHKTSPTKGRCWFTSRARMEELIKDNRVWFGEDGKNTPRIKRFLSEVKDGLTPMTIWRRTDVGDNQDAAREIKELFEYPPFDTPKPVRLIERMVHFGVNEGDIILDFFGGSGTTAHAVWEHSQKNNKVLQFIIVQIPEPLETNKEALSEWKHLADVSAERIRRASKKHYKSAKDRGFRYVKLKNSNYKTWRTYAGSNVVELESSLSLFNQEPLQEHWTVNGLLSEIALIEGFALSASIAKIASNKQNSVYHISDEYCGHSLLICLDKEVKAETIQTLELTGNDIFICLDSAISNVDKLRLSDKGLIKTI